MCGICGKLAPERICPKCKIEINNLAIFGCEDYTQTSSFFNEHIYFFQYTGNIREAILNYKFRDMSYIYETFVNCIKYNEKICKFIKKYDIIMPIPISKRRLKERGYNQSSLIAKKIAKNLNIEYREDILIKIKDNNRQSELTQEERMLNVHGVYIAKKTHLIKNKKILLVDDIFTTGNTANECSRILKNYFAGNIGVFTIAKD